VAGRYLVLRVVITDRPGELAHLTARLAEMGLNVLDVDHHRSGARVAFDQVEVLLTVETRGRLHASEIAQALALALAGNLVEVVG